MALAAIYMVRPLRLFPPLTLPLGQSDLETATEGTLATSPLAAIAGDKRKAAISIAAIFVGGKRSAGVSVGDLKDVGTRKVAKVVAPADAEIGPLLEKVPKRAPAPVVEKGAAKHAAPAAAEICSLEPVHKPSPAALKAGLLDVPAPAVETIVNAVLVHQSSPAPAAEKVGAVSETPCHNTFERVPRQGYLVGLFQTPGGCFCAGHDPKPRPRRTVTDLVAEYNGLEKTVAEVRIGIDKRTKGSMFSVFLAEEADTTLVPWDEEADGTIVEAEARVSKQQFEGTDDYCVGRVRFTGQFRSGNPVLKASLNSSNSTARSVEGFANAPCYYEGDLDASTLHPSGGQGSFYIGYEYREVYRGDFTALCRTATSDEKWSGAARGSGFGALFRMYLRQRSVFLRG